MKRYEAYKSTGIEWIGEVPEHWEVNRIKFLAKRSASGVWGDDEKGNDNDIVCYRVADFDYNHLTLKNEELTYRNISNSELEGRCISKGDLLIEKSGGGDVTPVGRVVISNNTNRATCSNFVHSITLKEDYNSSFMCYYFHALYSNEVNLLYFNQTTGIQNLKVYEYLGQHIYLPPLSEQVAIAKYLDEKCGSIDKVIATQEKRVALLNELKQSVISEAVTRVINTDVPLKDTGIEWIGEIPEHWEVKRLRFVCEFRNGYTPSKANPDFWEDGTIPWYRMEDIRDSGRYLNEAKQYVTEEAVKGAGLFEAGSFILATTATIGEHAMLIVDSLANQRFTNLKIRKSLTQALNKDFFFYYLYVIDIFCKSSTRTATFPAMNMEDLKNFGVTLPPIKEQEKIVEYLNTKTTAIDTLISKANKEIELLKEYKQTVISEAVTGKIKVC